MDTMLAYARACAARAQDKPEMVFDWDKCAAILRERGARNAEAFLAEDREWTGGSILREGAIVPEEDTYIYLASCWAKPMLEVDGEEIECWRLLEGSGWDEKTYWPASARAIFAGEASCA